VTCSFPGPTATRCCFLLCKNGLRQPFHGVAYFIPKVSTSSDKLNEVVLAIKSYTVVSLPYSTQSDVVINIGARSLLKSRLSVCWSSVAMLLHGDNVCAAMSPSPTLYTAPRRGDTDTASAKRRLANTDTHLPLGHAHRVPALGE